MAECRVVRGCGGSSSWIITSTTAINKSHVGLFTRAAFSSPEHFAKSGMFYVKKGSFVASVVFGLTKINARCNGGDCNGVREEFLELVRAVESS
jgi:hypothetical protein